MTATVSNVIFFLGTPEVEARLTRFRAHGDFRRAFAMVKELESRRKVGWGRDDTWATWVGRVDAAFEARAKNSGPHLDGTSAPLEVSP